MLSTVIDTAVNAAIRSLIADDDLLSAIPVFAAMSGECDDVPVIIHSSVVAEDIPQNHTYEVTLVVGVLASSNQDETPAATANAWAIRLGGLIRSRRFMISLDAIATNSSPRFAVASPPRETASAAVEVEGTYTYNQSATITWHAQF